jgi:hypothetical protein
VQTLFLDFPPAYVERALRCEKQGRADVAAATLRNIGFTTFNLLLNCA